MKRKTITAALGGLIATALVMGCATMKPVQYAFPGEGSETALVYFVVGNPGVELVYLNGKALPEAEKGTYWNPISVTAGKELVLRVHANYSQSSTSSSNLLVALASAAITSSRSVDSDVEFTCPPLEAGKEYVLEFRKGNGLKGKNALILTDKATKNIVFQQDF